MSNSDSKLQGTHAGLVSNWPRLGTEEIPYRYVLWGSLLIFFLRFILPYWTNSFWTDEAVSYWVSMDSLREAISRSFRFQNHSYLYFCYTWLLQQFLPASEWALRATNLPFAIGTVFCFHSFSKKSFGKPVACAACCLLIFSQEFYSAAYQYRPYILCLFFIALSLNFAVSHSQNYRSFAFAGISWGLAVALHPAYIASLSLLLICILYTPIPDRNKTRSIFIFLAFASLSFCVFGPNAVATALRRQQLALALPSSIDSLVAATLLSKYLVLSCLIAIGGLTSICLSKKALISVQSKALRTFLSLGGACLCAPMTKWLFDNMLGLSLDVDRYWLWVIFPQVLLLATSVDFCFKFQSVSVYLTCFLALALFWSLDNTVIASDLRGTIQQLKAAHRKHPNCGIVFQSPLIESTNNEYFADSDSLNYLASPLKAYHFEFEFEMMGLDGRLRTPPLSPNCNLLLTYNWKLSPVMSQFYKAGITNRDLAIKGLGQNCARLHESTDVEILYCSNQELGAHRFH